MYFSLFQPVLSDCHGASTEPGSMGNKSVKPSCFLQSARSIQGVTRPHGQQLVNKRGFHQEQRGRSADVSGSMVGRVRAACTETACREPWRVDRYKDVWRSGGHSCRRTFKEASAATLYVQSKMAGSLRHLGTCWVDLGVRRRLEGW